ncbi:HK97 gp10 family phage protein [Pseudomonas cannabina]|uniref:HK97 gp10 family phage protein n=1 Tax=Pseudomonas cannabina pv. alisalensis TaxID=757414 RepID=A0ABS1XFE5_PSEC1|nr:HK97 gp10 family phage protein [Pseudomonas cannabina]MBM0140203.1 HK97 gp10 family phage protein [Pseudomonas cannabina pv. alisalensis]
MASSWSVNPAAFATQVEEDLTKLNKDIVVKLVEVICEKSPIDTGRFINNHKISVGTPNYDIYIRYGSTGFEEYSERGNETARSLAVAVAKIKPYSLVYIQNNLHYAEDLETGTSKQAPRGVYGPSLEVVSEKFK